MITLKAQAIGAGIGVGSGTRYMLGLRAPAATDTVPSTVTVNKPSDDEVWSDGRRSRRRRSHAGKWVNWMGATIISAGGTVSNLVIALALDHSLPFAAGVTVTGTGTFYPAGGTGATGTTLETAFTSAARSGIGTYTLTASATDVAGNTGSTAKAFKLTYALEFTKASAQPTCAGGGTSNCTGQFHFTLRRSSVTSNGALMFDRTVPVDLVNTATTPSSRPQLRHGGYQSVGPD